MTVDLRVRLGRLELPNPVLTSAGTFGYGLEFRDSVPLRKLGGIITKTLTPAPRAGNPPPRLVETPAGMLNAVGLQNMGLEAFVREKLPRLQELGPPIIVSILGDGVDDVGQMCAQLDRTSVAAIELNLSCPNLKQRWGLGAGGWEPRSTALTPQPPAPSSQPMMVAQDPEATAAVVQAARAHTTKPLIAKLSPDVTDLRPVAQAAQQAGAEILSLVNTFIGMSIDPDTRRSRLGALTGGLSGPAIRPLAVYRVWTAAQAVSCPIIGGGGIVRGEDAAEFLIAGASAVAVGTATFARPDAAVRVVEGLQRWLFSQGLTSVAPLVGSLHAARLSP